MDLQLKGKKALVLGGSSGIGKAIAQVLVQEGAEVVIAARNGDTLKKACAEIGAKSNIITDLSTPAAGKKVVEDCIAAIKGIDILVTNTGGPSKGPFNSITATQWQNDFQNLWLSVVDSVNAALPIMKQQSFGRIIMITSLAAKEPLPGLTTSNGLRAGLSGLCKSMAQEFAPFGITVNAILPGYTDTDRLRELGLTEERIKAMIPAARLAHATELGDFCAFLASPRAGYITGQSLLIDGGATKGY